MMPSVCKNLKIPLYQLMMHHHFEDENESA